MDAIFLFLIISATVVLILIAINAFLLWYFSKTNKKIDQLLEKGKIKSFKDIFLAQKEKNDDLEKEIKNSLIKIEKLEGICNTTIRKIGVVRFNPFSDMGGNQSFVIALLDNKNNGFLISSLFTKEGSRVYAKSIKEGKSERALSAEEQEAISRAYGAGNPNS